LRHNFLQRVQQVRAERRKLAMDWKKLLLAAGGAAAVGTVLYYVLKDEGSAGKKLTVEAEEKKKSKASVEELTKEQVQEILQEIIHSAELMKGHMRDLTQELLKNTLTFDQTYKKVKEVQPIDPLEKHGLSMMDFDQCLDKHQSDPNIREAIAKIMGAPNPSRCASEKVQAINVKKILDVHNFMFQELDKLVIDFNSLTDKESYDMKTVTVVAQAMVGSKIEAKFGITSEDIESAVLMYHTMLATDQEFAAINIKIQHTMGKLMGTPFAPH